MGRRIQSNDIFRHNNQLPFNFFEKNLYTHPRGPESEQAQLLSWLMGLWLPAVPHSLFKGGPLVILIDYSNSGRPNQLQQNISG